VNIYNKRTVDVECPVCGTLTQRPVSNIAYHYKAFCSQGCWEQEHSFDGFRERVGSRQWEWSYGETDEIGRQRIYQEIMSYIRIARSHYEIRRLAKEKK
jgi:hypothetical protein